MARAFADITFTESVKAAQVRYGSREFNRRFETAPEPRNQLNEFDREFISNRDSFYQSSVGSNGWPYVQHRGGPIGFLKVLDNRTLAYADFSGNRQYISVGNMMDNNKVCLFLMDYARQQRLKIWGLSEIVHTNENETLISQLLDDTYKAVVERAVVITVEALEWNCSKHITPRFTEQDITPWAKNLIDENTALKERISILEARNHDHTV